MPSRVAEAVPDQAPAWTLLTGPPTPTDGLAAVLAWALGPDGEWPAAADRLRPAFHALRAQHHLLRARLAFSRNGISPFSGEVEDALDPLSLSGRLKLNRPDCTRTCLTRSGPALSARHILPHLPGTAQRDCRALAAGFGQACRTAPVEDPDS